MFDTLLKLLDLLSCWRHDPCVHNFVAFLCMMKMKLLRRVILQLANVCSLLIVLLWVQHRGTFPRDTPRCIEPFPKTKQMSSARRLMRLANMCILHLQRGAEHLTYAEDPSHWAFDLSAGGLKRKDVDCLDVHSRGILIKDGQVKC